MKQSKPIIILPGQLYYDETKNEYLIISRHQGDTTSYEGHGFRGMLETDEFLERFQPVDPADLEQEELDELVNLCRVPVVPKIGFIKD